MHLLYGFTASITSLIVITTFFFESLGKHSIIKDYKNSRKTAELFQDLADRSQHWVKHLYIFDIFFNI